jgi:hypothetical protein
MPSANDVTPALYPVVIGLHPELPPALEHSDEVLETVLKLSSRRDLLISKKVQDSRRELRELLVELDRLLGE